MLIDLVFVGILVLALIKGYTRGLVIAVFSLVALIVGVAAAVKLSTVAASWLQSSVNTSARWLPVLAFVGVFLAVVLLVRLAAKAIEKTVELAQLGWANRIAGILLYVVLYIVVLSVVLFYADKAHLLAEKTMAGSKTYPYIRPWGPRVVDGLGRILPFFSNMFHELEAFFEKVSGKIPPL